MKATVTLVAAALCICTAHAMERKSWSEQYAEGKQRLKPYIDAVVAKCESATDPDACSRRETGYRQLGIPPEDASIVSSGVNEVFTAREIEKERATQAENRAACGKRGLEYGTVRIGMNESIVMVCGWGNPINVNRTTTGKRVTEQWVYGDGRYLYFTDGKLTAIQD